ncbi:MAG: hypothetical protein HC842_04235 [Cytophagales bacterium]|nr:hypothetical protein [Cytophagales bacterium]
MTYDISADSIKTTWIYTKSQIDHLINNYSDMLSDPLTAKALKDSGQYERIQATLSNWNQVKYVLEVSSLPHYQFCKAHFWDKDSPEQSVREFCRHFFDDTKKRLHTFKTWRDLELSLDG